MKCRTTATLTFGEWFEICTPHEIFRGRIVTAGDDLLEFEGPDGYANMAPIKKPRTKSRKAKKR